jgi:hypothetical protein
MKAYFYFTNRFTVYDNTMEILFHGVHFNTNKGKSALSENINCAWTCQVN